MIPDVVWTPQARFRQEDPFSPAVFVLLAFVIIPILESTHPDLCAQMYADDLVIYISCSEDEAEPLLEDTFHALRTVGLPTGLRMNVSKSKVLRKGPNMQSFVFSSRLKVADKIENWGVTIGRVT